jgi:hypothetical protein
VALTSTGFHVLEELPALFSLKMGAEGQTLPACSSETLASLYQITQHHIPEDCNLDIHCCENLKFHILPSYVQDKLRIVQ